ncbi:MAG: DUF2867 domain-containing protein, partial [Campylobacterales bacterium]|nr:DUF2867 domain-containing protein [Campylobacterales bacterium]
ENQIYSRWSDAGSGGDVWEAQHKNDPSSAILMDRQIIQIEGVDHATLYKTFCAIGGKGGWFGYEWLWEIRGGIDKLIAGAGLNRGRRDRYRLRVGESLDFWRVEDIVPNERLLLRAQMKVPGKAWLEFKIQGDEFIQTAYFYPKGLWGRLYWYLLTPLHYIIFGNMIRSIYTKAQQHQITKGLL